MKPSDYIFSIEMQVRDYELDYQGIVNNSVYLNYMEHTRHRFCIQAGLPFAAMHEKGIDPVLVKAEIDYRHALHSGDTFTSCLRVSRKGPLFVFEQALFLPDGSLSAKARISIATIENGKLTRGDSLVEVFKQYLTPRS